MPFSRASRTITRPSALDVIGASRFAGHKVNSAHPRVTLRLCGHAFAKRKCCKASRRISPLLEVTAPFVELLVRGQTVLYSRRHDRRRMEPVQCKLKEETNVLRGAKRFEGSACSYVRKARLKKVIP